MIFAQRGMEQARIHGEIPNSQYAKKYSQAIDAAMVKGLFFDYLRIYKLPGIMICNDARGCFDRMALIVGSLCFHRLKIPHQEVRTLMTTLQKMKHYVRSGHRDSKTYYSGTQDKPLQGGGQGNGAAGPMWIAISIIMINIINSIGIGATLISAISLAAMSITAVMYVDKTNLLITVQKNENSESLMNKAQK